MAALGLLLFQQPGARVSKTQMSPLLRQHSVKATRLAVRGDSRSGQRPRVWCPKGADFALAIHPHQASTGPRRLELEPGAKASEPFSATLNCAAPVQSKTAVGAVRRVSHSIKAPMQPVPVHGQCFGIEPHREQASFARKDQVAVSDISGIGSVLKKQSAILRPSETSPKPGRSSNWARCTCTASTVKRTALPSGRKCGRRCDTSLAVTSSVVNSSGSPPVVPDHSEPAGGCGREHDGSVRSPASSPIESVVRPRSLQPQSTGVRAGEMNFLDLVPGHEPQPLSIRREERIQSSLRSRNTRLLPIDPDALM